MSQKQYTFTFSHIFCESGFWESLKWVVITWGVFWGLAGAAALKGLAVAGELPLNRLSQQAAGFTRSQQSKEHRTKPQCFWWLNLESHTPLPKLRAVSPRNQSGLSVGGAHTQCQFHGVRSLGAPCNLQFSVSRCHLPTQLPQHSNNIQNDALCIWLWYDY